MIEAYEKFAKEYKTQCKHFGLNVGDKRSFIIIIYCMYSKLLQDDQWTKHIVSVFQYMIITH